VKAIGPLSKTSKGNDLERLSLYERAAINLNHNPEVNSAQLAPVLSCTEKTAASLRSLWRRAGGDWKKMREMKNEASRHYKAEMRASIRNAA